MHRDDAGANSRADIATDRGTNTEANSRALTATDTGPHAASNGGSHAPADIHSNCDGTAKAHLDLHSVLFSMRSRD